MAFPDGVTLCEVVLPASAVWQGGASTITATLTPTRSVFHRKTGEQLVAITGSATGPSGPGLKLLVPHTQQSNYRDAKGNSIAGWEYELLATYRDTANVAQTLRKQLRIPTGTTSLNLLSAVDYEPANEFSGVLGGAAPQLAFDTDGTPYIV
ncbi:hypothetical protein J2X12_002909 [Pseudarthrobacter oxydans]|uniref:Uncharacterized protein n=1 Tax=Pseudarthrobacter oxydans TaxID=1671 RepID=A0AAW8NCW1_PSEOX|nr:hypothetical protein [Pseudarthrobacter oxydans]MDR6794354.1 hypothetical protein [Pseudarthrobacter oxydans]MDR7164871.1 hypothetical protein [Pseudarthrobacter oxydans]